jgi:hypothetical protein
MLNAILSESYVFILIASSAACGLLGFLIARYRHLNGWLGGALGVGFNLLVASRALVRFTAWGAGLFEVPYSDGLAALVVAAVAALVFVYPLAVRRLRRQALTALAITLAATVMSLVIHVRAADLYTRATPRTGPALPTDGSDLPGVPTAKKAAAAVAPPPAPPVETEVLRLVTQDTLLYSRGEKLFVAKTHVVRKGSWVLLLPPGPGPREEDWVEVMLATPDGRYIPNWSPHGFVRERMLGQSKSRPKSSSQVPPQQARTDPRAARATVKPTASPTVTGAPAPVAKNSEGEARR